MNDKHTIYLNAYGRALALDNALLNKRHTAITHWDWNACKKYDARAKQSIKLVNSLFEKAMERH